MFGKVFRYILTFLGVTLLLSMNSYAGVLSATSTEGTAGTTFTISWAQGCPAQVISGISLPQTGPNTCAPQKPFYCPIDSVGTSGFIQDCNNCSCGYLSECVRSTGLCQQCVDPCDDPDYCSAGYTCVSSPPSVDNSCAYSVDCIPQSRNILYNVYLNTALCFWFLDDPGRYINNVPVDTWRYGNLHEWPRNGLCGPKAVQVRVRWTGGATAPVCEKVYDSDGGFRIIRCQFAGYLLNFKCGWPLGGTYTGFVSGPIDEGDSFPITLNCLTLAGISHGAVYQVRNVGGSIQCKQNYPFGTGGQIRTNLWSREWGPSCDTSTWQG